MKKKFLHYSLTILLILIFVKIFDLTTGFFFKRNISNQQFLNRSINLREHMPLTDKFVMPSKLMLDASKKLKKKKYRLRTDKDGYIVGNNWTNLDNLPVDIIFIGGSTTESLYVEEEYRFPFLLSKLIKKNNGSNLKVLNGGVAGNNSIHSLINIIAKGIKHNPKFIVFMHNINDLGTLSKTLSYWEGPASRKIILSENYNKNQSIYNFFKSLKNFLIPNIWEIIPKNFQKKILLKKKDEWVEFRKKEDYFEIEKIFRKNFTSSVLSFVHISRSWNIEPILMTQFNRMNLDDLEIRSSYQSKIQPISFEEFVSLYDLGNQIIRDISYKENILLIDLDKDIPPTENYIYDAAHLTKQGSELVANIIAEKLLIEKENFFTKFD